MDEQSFEKILYGVIAVVAVVLILNQFQISSLQANLHVGGSGNSITGAAVGGMDLSAVDVTEIQSTAQGIVKLFPIHEIKTQQDAIDVMIPTGTPSYGEAMGVTFDDPINSLNVMAQSWPAMKQKYKTENPEAWERYVNLASQPRGVSCEFCCGIGPTGASANGESRCGCQHNPGVLTLTLWLAANTDMTDAEILREVYKWKTLWFPKNMVGMAAQIAGGDDSVLKDLPGMVGGC